MAPSKPWVVMIFLFASPASTMSRCAETCQTASTSSILVLVCLPTSSPARVTRGTAAVQRGHGSLLRFGRTVFACNITRPFLITKKVRNPTPEATRTDPLREFTTFIGLCHRWCGKDLNLTVLNKSNCGFLCIFLWFFWVISLFTILLVFNA